MTDDGDDATRDDEPPAPAPVHADPPARAGRRHRRAASPGRAPIKPPPQRRSRRRTDDEHDDDDDAALLTEHSGHHTTFDESAPVYTGPAPLAPSFVREAERDARWQRPVVRRLTIAAALALPLLLGAQVALHHRDLLAARWPGSADLLGALCAPLNCSVQAPRSLDAVSVESSGLTRVEGAPLYKLQVAVRNRAAWAVAMPALDLTLTDPRGEIVTRRVLRAAELGGARPKRWPPAPNGRRWPRSTSASAASPATRSTSSTPESKSKMPALICGSLAFDTITHLPRPLCAADPARAGAHPQRLVPGADAAPRVGRLRRQHRLHAEDARRRAGDPGRARRATATSTWRGCRA